MIRYSTLFILPFLLLFAGCAANNDNDENEIDVTGLTTVESSSTVDATVNSLQGTLQSNENIGIVATVNHSANAQNAGLDLRSTQVILFGNPQLGTPLMQANQTAGIDLPQQVLVYQNEDDKVIVGYNDPSYIANRHGISEQDETLNTISNALANIVGTVSTGATENDSSDDVEAGEGLILVQSAFSVDSTFQNLVDAI